MDPKEELDFDRNRTNFFFYINDNSIEIEVRCKDIFAQKDYNDRSEV